MSLQSRLAKLSHVQLLQFAVDACESSPELKNKADALIAQVAPLPAWCVDILMSPDLLPQLFSSLGLSEHAAAGVCSTWLHAYRRQLRRCRYINPTSLRRLADVPDQLQPVGLCMLPGGVLAITSGPGHGNDAVKFVAARNDTDQQALAACQASTLAAGRFQWLMGMARTNDGLLACNLDEESVALYKFAVDGLMDELATAPALAEYGRGFGRCAVHQQTQRTFAVAISPGNESNAVTILDSHLQVVATVEAAESTEEDGPIRDVAVHGDQVIVLTSDVHPKGPGLRLLDLDGRFLRTIAAGQLRHPHAVAASHGRVFVIDEELKEDDEDDEALVLHVIEIHSGNIFQTIPLEVRGRDISSMIVDGDEIYIAELDANRVIALRIAGSEA